MYCAWRIPAHLRYTQCSFLLHLMDICFLTCICLWQISQIQTFLFKVVGPGLVSTSPAFVSSSASHPAGPHGRHAQKNVNRAPITGELSCAIPLHYPDHKHVNISWSGTHSFKRSNCASPAEETIIKHRCPSTLSTREQSYTVIKNLRKGDCSTSIDP